MYADGISYICSAQDEDILKIDTFLNKNAIAQYLWHLKLGINESKSQYLQFRHGNNSPTDKVTNSEVCVLGDLVLCRQGHQHLTIRSPTAYDKVTNSDRKGHQHRKNKVTNSDSQGHQHDKITNTTRSPTRQGHQHDKVTNTPRSPTAIVKVTNTMRSPTRQDHQKR